MISLCMSVDVSMGVCCNVAARGRSDNDIVEVSVAAKLNNVSAVVCNSDRLLTDIQISGFHVLLLTAAAAAAAQQLNSLNGP